MQIHHQNLIQKWNDVLTRTFDLAPQMNITILLPNHYHSYEVMEYTMIVDILVEIAPLACQKIQVPEKKHAFQYWRIFKVKMYKLSDPKK